MQARIIDKRMILSLLRRHYSLSRSDLVTLTGVTDRAIRAAIAELVIDGFPITSGSAGAPGYRLVETREELEKEIRILGSYIRSIFKRLRGLQAARTRYGSDGILQIDLFEEELRV